MSNSFNWPQLTGPRYLAKLPIRVQTALLLTDLAILQQGHKFHFNLAQLFGTTDNQKQTELKCRE